MLFIILMIKVRLKENTLIHLDKGGVQYLG
jgi:hypothetical protein